jgi:hypothetical protein
LGLAAFFAVADDGNLAGWPLILPLVAAALFWALYGER